MAVSESNLSEQDKKRIEAVCDRREIEHLVHFTQLSNLETILQKEALIPVEHLERDEVEINDTGRYDNHPDASSLSVEFPNYSMFYKYRQEKDDTYWVVLKLDCSILWDLDCAFYHENAASGTFRNVPPVNLKSSDSFEKMFHDVEYKGITVIREDLNIPSRFTTNPQAEILVFSDIPLEYINEVVCESFGEKQVLEDEIESLPVGWNRNFFNYRNDYEIWQAISKADSGEDDFQKKLGVFYEKGDYVNKDLEQAVLWYRRSASHGNAIAKNKLGCLYAKGEGVDHDFEEAIGFFQSSADLGCAMAKFNLGLCHEEGWSVEKDLSEAKKWYKKSAEEGDRRVQKKARKKLQELEEIS